jgi:tungstate transport system ATP-binding protein
VVVRRAAATVLQVDHLEIARGEVLALVGPNGAGKTTFLLTIARLLKPQAGEIIFDGKSLDDWDPLTYRRSLSFVFQSPLLLDMSVAENVGLGLGFRGMAMAERQVRVMKWLRRLGIGSLAKRRAGELSGGESQRVSLARAFVLDPKLLLLDEPFPGLDPPARLKLFDDLAALLSHDHRTAILVTHNLQEAERLGNRVGVMIGGALRQVGTPREIRARPADAQVAAFVRSMPR